MVALVFRFIFNCKVIFDLQENFGLNLKHQKSRKSLWAGLKAKIANLYLQFSLLFIDQIWIAEKIYASQFHLKEGKYLLLENKVPEFWAQPSNFIPAQNLGPYLFFSGFITEETGIYPAILFFEHFKMAHPDWKMVIAGYCPSKQIREFILQKSVEDSSFVCFGIDKWLSSKELLQLMEGSQAIIMSYFETEANRSKFPTRFFEAAFLGKPIVSKRNSQFKEIPHLEELLIEVDFENPEQNDFNEISIKIKSSFPKPARSKEFLFDSESLRDSIRNLLKPAS